MRIALYLLIAVAAVAFIVFVISRAKAKLSATMDKKRTTADEDNTASDGELTGPGIIAFYQADGGLLEDGKCGWLDIEREDGEEQTIKLNFNKKAPTPITVPLTPAAYRITYRTQSKAAMAASGILNAINESNGAIGSFANAVYDVGGMNGKLESVVVKVDESFVLKLRCTTDGINKSCEVIN